MSTRDFALTQDEAVAIDQQARAAKAAADAAHVSFGQYAGHWDGPEWIAVRIKLDVRTKLGLAFAAGEVTIAKKPFQWGLYCGEFFTAYSLKNEIDTSVHYGDVEVL